MKARVNNVFMRARGQGSPASPWIPLRHGLQAGLDFWILYNHQSFQPIKLAKGNKGMHLCNETTVRKIPGKMIGTITFKYGSLTILMTSGLDDDSTNRSYEEPEHLNSV